MAYNPSGTLWTAGSGYGTGVAEQAVHTAFADTAPLWVMQNTSAAGPSIWPKWLRLILSGTAPTATSALQLAVQVDVISKLPTNANQYTNPTPVNVDTRDSTSKSVMTLYQYVNANAMVTPASSASVRKVCRGAIVTGLGITGDTYEFQFGFQDLPWVQGASPLAVARATDVAKMTAQCGGFNIGPGQWATIHLWWLTEATNGATWESDWGWYEL